jgi:hypothetical protein
LKSIIQPEAINVSQWHPDEMYFNYPEGARSKTAFFPPIGLDLDFILPNRRYLYKRSVGRYPDQFWGEIVAYQIGCLLDLSVPPAFAAFDPEKGDCAALIEWFYEDDRTIFVSGGNYMQGMMPDYDRKRGTQHNFYNVRILCNEYSEQDTKIKFDFLKYWAETFLFDALTGNTDRHQDNWGLLFLLNAEGNHVTTKFTPLFDNGTSLGHELFVANIAKWNDDQFVRYIDKGKHHMKWQKDDKTGCGHVEMLMKVISKYPEFREGLFNRINNFSIDDLSAILSKLEKLNLTVSLSRQRIDLYLKLITLRQKNIIVALS